MRQPWQLAGIWHKFRKSWRIRNRRWGREELTPQLFSRRLEERRVLTVGPMAATGMGSLAAAVALGREPAALASNDSLSTSKGDVSKGDAIKADATRLSQAAIAPQGAAKVDSAQLATGRSTSPSGGGNVAAAQVQVSQPQLSEDSLVLGVAGDQSVDEGSQLSITDIGQFTESDSSSLSDTFTYSIDWGDGRPADSGSATIDSSGSSESPTMGSFDGQHIYADNGDYTVNVTISDQHGNSAVGTLDVIVANVAPTVVAAPDQTVNEGAQLSITNIGQFTDPGFDNPLNVGGETSETFAYAIDWGDGTPVDSGSPTIDTPGGPGVLTAGSFDGQHIYADNGIYTVTITVADDDGGSDTKTFAVTVDNVAPTLTVVPNQTVNEGAQLSITNVGQFTDPGFNNPLNVGGETSETFAYAINWGDGTPVDSGSPTIDTPGGPGVLTAGSFDGQHIYADNGVYTVTVTVADDDGGSATKTFAVTVDNVAPTLTVVPNQTVNEGSQLSLTNIGQFTDPGFDNPQNIPSPTVETFTYAINWGDGTSVDSGAATVDVHGSPGVLTAGSFDGQHTFADNGLYTVTVKVTDDDGGSATTKTFAVTVDNVAPTLTVVPNQTVNEGSQLTLTNIGQFTGSWLR